MALKNDAEAVHIHIIHRLVVGNVCVCVCVYIPKIQNNTNAM